MDNGLRKSVGEASKDNPVSQNRIAQQKVVMLLVHIGQ